MASVSRSALVPFSAERMYQLVNDCDSYPEFLPWCRSTQVHSYDDDQMHVTIEMSKGALQKSFTTHNRLQKNRMVEIRLVNGPFRRLEGFWRFHPLREDACKVSLDLEFEFSGSVINKVAGPIFHQIANTLVDSFCNRARDIYGR